MSRDVASVGTGGWRPAHALRRAVLLGLVLPGAAVATGRADLLVLGAPLAIGTVLAVLAGPRRLGTSAPPSATVRVARLAGQGQRVRVGVDLDLPAGTQAALVRLPTGDVVPFGLEAGVPGPGLRRLGTQVLLRRWGRVSLVRPDLRAIGPDALVLHDPLPGAETTVRVLPAVDRPVPAPLPPRSAGVVGAHRTRRAGEGTDLLDVCEFRPGDRMRRIDWRVSARRGTLHVRRTAVDADADVVLALDTRLDVGGRARQWPTSPGAGALGSTAEGSSLDLGVRTAASLAAAFLAQGDRVSVLDLSRPRLSCPPGTGRRHLRRVRRQLAEAAVVDGAGRLLLRPGVVPPGAVLLLLSPFLDAPPADLAQRMALRGTQMMAVDVLPPVDPTHRVRRDEVAARLVLAERAARLDLLRRAGVQVCPADAALVARLLREAARRRQRVGR